MKVVVEAWVGARLVARSVMAPMGKPIGVDARGALVGSAHQGGAVYAWLAAKGHALYAMSADPACPALALRSPLPTAWTRISLPCTLQACGVTLLAKALEAQARTAEPATEEGSTLGSDEDDTPTNPSLRPSERAAHGADSGTTRVAPLTPLPLRPRRSGPAAYAPTVAAPARSPRREHPPQGSLQSSTSAPRVEATLVCAAPQPAIAPPAQPVLSPTGPHGADHRFGLASHPVASPGFAPAPYATAPHALALGPHRGVAPADGAAPLAAPCAAPRASTPSDGTLRPAAYSSSLVPAASVRAARAGMTTSRMIVLALGAVLAIAVVVGTLFARPRHAAAPAAASEPLAVPVPSPVAPSAEPARREPATDSGASDGAPATATVTPSPSSSVLRATTEPTAPPPVTGDDEPNSEARRKLAREGERRVAEAMFAGDFVRAAREGGALADAFPDSPEYPVIVRVLRARSEPSGR